MVQIHWCHTDWLKGEERAEIEERIESLAAEGQGDLLDVRIVGKPTQHHRSGGHEVRITCDARGREIVVVREGDQLGQALHDALDAFKLQVRNLRKRRRDHGPAARSAARSRGAEGAV
jgi:hypothetical protein